MMEEKLSESGRGWGVRGGRLFSDALGKQK